MSISKLTRHRHTLTCFLLCFVLLLSPFSYYGISKAHALSIGGIFGGGGGDRVQDIGNTLQNTLQALSLGSLEQKELVIDGMFFDMAQKALQQMTGDIITWLNSGLNGDPAFVTDVLGNLQDVSDQAAADFIYSQDLSTICPHAQTDVRQALANTYATANYGQYKEKVTCPLDGGKAEEFFAGDFYAGGWAAWFEIMLNPEKTPIGATIAGEAELARLTEAERYAKNKEWDWGRGVESKKACSTVGSGASATQKCLITTPGAIMQDLASKALGTGIDSLLNADEANEVIGLLFGNLAKEAITGTNGLLGLGGNSNFTNNSFGTNGNLSYLDAIREEQANKQTTGVNGNQIQQALATETRVLELQLAIVDAISTTTALFASSSEDYIAKSCWDLDIPDALSTTLVQISAKLPTTIGTVITLQDMVEEFASSTSAAGQSQILQELSSMQSQGILSGQPAVVEYDYFLNSELKPFIVDFKKKIAAEVKGCS